VTVGVVRVAKCRRLRWAACVDWLGLDGTGNTSIQRTVVPEPLGKLSRTQIHINYYKIMPAFVLSGTKPYGRKGNITPENSDTQFWTADRNRPARVPVQ
jgi:hypothetical protein